MPKVSDEHRDAVRRKLMDAALSCLMGNEFRDVTTREILAEAGLSTGTFYNYFPSKEHLYEALAEELLSEDLARLTQAPDGAPHQLGHALIRFLADFALVDPEAAIAVSTFRGRMHTSGDAADAIGRLNQFVVREFTPLVEQAQAAEFLRGDLDASAVVELLDIIWDGLGRRAATQSFQTSYERVGAVVLQLLLSGALGPAAEADLVDTAPRRRNTPRNARYEKG